MKIGDLEYTSIWVDKENSEILNVIDQRKLPHEFVILDILSFDDALYAIQEMVIRGAPLIGVMAAYAMYFAVLESVKTGEFELNLKKAAIQLKNSRPTAVDLFKAVKRMEDSMETLLTNDQRRETAFHLAGKIREESLLMCKSIGKNGLAILEEIYRKKKDTINILTHCNAGWLATVDYGTATAPVYAAFDKGIPVHVWVDETRPRNQGASLTAWELLNHGVPHTVIVDNAGGHLMQHGMVDIVIVGTDRTTKTGDVANKIGTYLKALAAKDNHIFFYVAAPSGSIDFTISDGLKEIKIEERSPDEVRYIRGWNGKESATVLITPEKSPAKNFGFDVTPARLITGLITERGVCEASEKGLNLLFPELLKEKKAEN